MSAKRTLIRLKQKYIEWNENIYVMRYDKNTDFPCKDIGIEKLIADMQEKIRMISKILYKQLNGRIGFDDIVQETNIITLKLLTVYDCKKGLWKTFWNCRILKSAKRELLRKRKCYIAREEQYAEKINNEVDNGNREL